jgi:hypothetical protein
MVMSPEAPETEDEKFSFMKKRSISECKRTIGDCMSPMSPFHKRPSWRAEEVTHKAEGVAHKADIEINSLFVEGIFDLLTPGIASDTISDVKDVKFN